MMIEGDRKEDRQGKEDREHKLIVSAKHRQRNNVNNHDDELGSNHVSHDRSHKKSVLTLKQNVAR